jgi:rSAM/selenodomain-associated transferase 1
MYQVLEAGTVWEDARGKVALAVMAKAPRVGKVKTRLAPTLGFEGSAAINVCFLKDTARNIAGVGGAVGVVCYTPVGEEAMFDHLLSRGFAMIAQREGDFGERLLRAAEDILSCGFAAVCLIDSDSPTMPTVALEMAVSELMRDGDRVVCGASEDGGYYLIGMKRAHAEPFARIAWSTGSVYAETVERCAEAGLEFVALPVWYDVDDGTSLAVLERELMGGERPAFAALDGFDAKETRVFLVERIAAGAGKENAESAKSAKVSQREGQAFADEVKD